MYLGEAKIVPITALMWLANIWWLPWGENSVLFRVVGTLLLAIVLWVRHAATYALLDFSPLMGPVLWFSYPLLPAISLALMIGGGMGLLFGALALFVLSFLCWKR